MLNRAPAVTRLIEALSLAALAASVGALGLLGWPRAGGAIAIVLGVLAALLLLAGLIALRHLARLREVALPEFEGTLLRTILWGSVFLAAVYHLSWAIRLFAIVHVSIDLLLPVWAGHVLGLAPPILLIAAAEFVLRQDPGAWAMHQGGRLKLSRPRAGRNKKKSKGGLHG